MLKRLLASVREYKRDTILTPIFVTIESVLDIMLPFLIASLIDKGIEAGNLTNVIKIGLLMLLSAMASMLFGILSGRSAARASAGFAKNLRHDTFYKVQGFSFASIDKFSTSSLVTRLTTDITNIQNAYMMSIRMACRAPSMMIFALIMSFRISPSLAMVYVCAIPLLAIALYTIIRFAHPTFTKVFKKYDQLNQVVRENLHGIRVVKSFVREDHEVEKFKDSSGAIYKLFLRAERFLAFNHPVMQIAMNGCVLLVSWIGAKLIVNSGGADLTTGQLTSVISYAGQVLMSLMMLSMFFVMITMSRASMERIDEVLSEEIDLENCENPISTVKDGSIKFENVSFSYSKNKDKQCLFGVDLDIPSGSTIGIIGGTGSSKSTLVQLIPRLYDTTEGSVYVGGVDVKDYDLSALRDSVSMVLQKNELFSGTIKENLRWGNENATDEELIEACKLSQADGFIREFPDGYDTFIEQGGTNVSGGQKQRLCIARALLKQPKILILDDSTSAVDTATDSHIRHGLKNFIPDTTKLIIAQRISSVEDADGIIVLDGGKIDGFGTHDELLKSNDIYKEVYYSQMKGGFSDGGNEE